MLFIDSSKISLKVQKRIEKKRNEKIVSPITIKDFIEDAKKEMIKCLFLNQKIKIGMQKQVVIVEKKLIFLY